MSTQPTPRSKAYRELLTTSLHRRFTNASSLVLLFCLVEAALLSNDSILRAWFPLGYTGLRALLLFIPCLFVFIIRVYNLHFGARTTTSGTQTLYQSLITSQAPVTFAWYFAAALFYAEIYIWSKGSEGNLGWVDQGRAYERARLNENPILLRCLFGWLAVIQTGAHLWFDIDRVALAQEEKTAADTKLETIAQKLLHRGLPIAKGAFNLAAAGLVTFPWLYWGFIRRTVWAPTHAFAKVFDGELPAKAGPSGLLHPSGLIWQACSSVFLLAALWGTSNTIFTYFMSQPPLKKGQPLTSDVAINNGVTVSRAVDANGSLINGLTRKKESPHTFALWELHLICTQFVERRKSIFLEVDRAGGSSWVQISRQCLSEIEAIGGRIQKHQLALSAAQSATQAQPAASEPTGLPRIATEGARQGDILSKPRPDFAQSLSAAARFAGQHPGAASPISPAARSAEKALGRLVPRERQPQLSIQSIDKQANGKLLQVLQTPLGEPFRETFARTAKVVVFGTPSSAQTNIIHAARSLAALLKASAEEDKYGVVAKDVPLIIRTVLGSIRSIRQFLATQKPSWTDVDFVAAHRQVPEVLEVIKELQKALETMLLAFGEYAISLGMSKKELREAKEAVGMNTNQEMVQVR